MSEEHAPSALLANAARAEDTGFDFVAISDHYHPWLTGQGHSPHAWTVLGAIATRAARVGLVTAVTCPFLRYHPAIVAQFAATLASGRTRKDFCASSIAGSRRRCAPLPDSAGRCDQSRKLICHLDILPSTGLTERFRTRTDCSTTFRREGVEEMSGPGEEHPRPARIALLCGDPRAPRIVAALQVLRDLGETTVGCGGDAASVVAQLDADVVIAEEWVGTRDGRILLAWATGTRPSAVGILLGSSRLAATAASLDGVVVLPKLVDAGTLRAVCALALDCAVLRQRVARAEVEVAGRRPALRHPGSDDVTGFERYDDVLVRSAAMRDVVATLRELETSDVTVLIQGETGTGKELVARAIHARSRRCQGPFVAVNVGAIPDGLRESELFGHVRGAFTGANDARGGVFLGADGGSLFLDEIGEASAALQDALLRVLEQSTIVPVGADRPRRIDVRVISATNQDLAELVRRGSFRRDLYYRLNVFPVRLPPLRERLDDVFPLAAHFLRRASRDAGRPPARLSHEARRALEAHAWEGNVRELRSVMERAALVCKGGVVGIDDLPFDAVAPAVPPADALPHGATLREIERQVLLKTLALADGNQSQAARILGLHESTLRFRLRRAGIATSRRAAGS